MKLLAIDTSSLACSIALSVDGELHERHEEQAREHTRLLTPMIRDVLAGASIETSQLDAIVLGNGPGSFIGMRIGASLAQGLAHAAGIEIVPVSSLAAVAAQVFAESDAKEVIVAQDAHMNEVYLGGFRRNECDLPVPFFPERLQTQTAIEELDASSADCRVAAGFGWQRYPGLMSANEDLIGRSSGVLHPHARFLVPLGESGLVAGKAVSPKDLVPAYLRNKVAEKPTATKP